jgi:hypothetical protein
MDQFSGSITADSSGNGSATVVPQGPYVWNVSGITLRSTTPSTTGTLSVLLDGNLIGMSYHPGSDVGSEPSPFPLSSTSTLTLQATGLMPGTVINYTLYYDKRLGP